MLSTFLDTDETTRVTKICVNSRVMCNIWLEYNFFLKKERKQREKNLSFGS